MAKTNGPRYLRLSGLDGQDIYLPNPKRILTFLHRRNNAKALLSGDDKKQKPFKFTAEPIKELIFSQNNKLFKFYSKEEYRQTVNLYCALFHGVDQELIESSFGHKKAKRYNTLFDSSLNRIPEDYLDEVALLIWHFTLSVPRDNYTSFHSIYTTNPDGSTRINEPAFREYLKILKSYFILS